MPNHFSHSSDDTPTSSSSNGRSLSDTRKVDARVLAWSSELGVGWVYYEDGDGQSKAALNDASFGELPSDSLSAGDRVVAFIDSYDYAVKIETQ